MPLGNLLDAAASGGGIGPSGVRSGEGLHLILGVGGDRIAVGVSLRRSVRVEHVEAHSEELHELARVVLVGDLRNSVTVPGLLLLSMLRYAPMAGESVTSFMMVEKFVESVVDQVCFGTQRPRAN